MPRTIDRRDFNYRRRPEPEVLLARTRERMVKEQRVRISRVHALTGSAVSVFSDDAQPATSEVDLTEYRLIERAQAHLRQLAPALGFEPGETPEFVADPRIKETSMGWRVVSLQQHHRGIPVFQMERVVVFDQAGSIQYVAGNSVGGLPAALETEPAIPIEMALQAAAVYLALPEPATSGWTKRKYTSPPLLAATYQPRLWRKSDTPALRQMFERGPFRHQVPVHLVYFYQGPATRIGWHCCFSLPEEGEQYVIIIEADSQAADLKQPQILYCSGTVCETGVPARGNVWTHNPGTHPARQFVDFPRPLTDYPISPLPASLPNGFPSPWVGDAHKTEGNNVSAASRQLSSAPHGSLLGGILTFDYANEESLEQTIVNAFYFCNFMHDFFFLLGFDEKGGNFQRVNLGGVDRDDEDEMQVNIVLGEVPKTAFLETGADGTGATITLGAVRLPDGRIRHTALDSDIVFHEYTHGVTKRLVGGSRENHALEQGQSAGLGEGWSDYFALTVQNFSLATEKTTIGDWVFDKPQGQRLAPYNDAYAERGSFGKIGAQGEYSAPHPIGEIWCATLMKMNRDLGSALGNRQRGHILGWQLVIDGLKLLAANPSFLDARDGILQAFNARRQSLTQLEAERCSVALQEVFKRFGMGLNARCNGNSLLNIVEDKNLPPSL